ncbi:MAG: hypothetical protein K6G65_01630 [Lachnospiraceae bacterium]|nr:hypothetical protein [Lachnospiraceae bacterium]
MEKNFFTDDDLADLLNELNASAPADSDKQKEEETDPEVLASERRFKEIIKKHSQH